MTTKTTKTTKTTETTKSVWDTLYTIKNSNDTRNVTTNDWVAVANLEYAMAK